MFSGNKLKKSYFSVVCKSAYKETPWFSLTEVLAATSPPGLLPSLKEEGKKKEVARDNKGWIAPR